MTEVAHTSSAFVKEVKFNWKINDFTAVFSASGGERMYSPWFKIGDRKCRLHLKTVSLSDLLEGVDDNVYIENHEKFAFNHILVIAVVAGKKKIHMSGFLSIDMKEDKISGSFGQSTRILQEGSVFLFKIQPYRNSVSIHHLAFCISRNATQIDIGVKLYFPSPISNTVSHVAEKDAGLAKLSADMRALLNRSSENADFSIHCGGKTFPCHEVILRARSTVLDAMFKNDMTEASARSMDAVDVGPGTIAAVLEYMYTGGITEEVDMKELIYIADKYDLEGLLEICFQKLPETADDMVVDFLFMADKHNFVKYKKQVMLRINVNKSKYLEDLEFTEKLKELPHLLLELYKL